MALKTNRIVLTQFFSNILIIVPVIGCFLSVNIIVNYTFHCFHVNVTGLSEICSGTVRSGSVSCTSNDRNTVLTRLANTIAFTLLLRAQIPSFNHIGELEIRGASVIF